MARFFSETANDLCQALLEIKIYFVWNTFTTCGHIFVISESTWNFFPRKIINHNLSIMDLENPSDSHVNRKDKGRGNNLLSYKSKMREIIYFQ